MGIVPTARGPRNTPDQCADCGDQITLNDLRQRGSADAKRGHWDPPIHPGLGVFACSEAYKAGHLAVTRGMPPDVDRQPMPRGPQPPRRQQPQPPAEHRRKRLLGFFRDREGVAR